MWGISWVYWGVQFCKGLFIKLDGFVTTFTTFIVVSATVLLVPLQCADDIFPLYSLFFSIYWTSPVCFKAPRVLKTRLGRLWYQNFIIKFLAIQKIYLRHFKNKQSRDTSVVPIFLSSSESIRSKAKQRHQNQTLTSFWVTNKILTNNR